MADMATLSLAIDATEVKQAITNLNQLVDTGRRTEQAAAAMGAAWDKGLSRIGADTSEIVRQLTALNAKQDAAAAGNRAMASSYQQVNASLSANAALMGQTNTATGSAANATAKHRDELSKLLSQIDPVHAAMGRLLETERQLAAFHASGALNATDFAKYSAMLDQTKKSMDSTGMSAKQMANNLRGLPAQFTDIVVSLQAGQAPLTVLLQQGGQLKDMFGGVGAAAKAMGSYIAGLITPVTALAGSMAAFGVAALQGASELRGLENAATLTGDSIGLTSQQLLQMSERMSESRGTVGANIEALTALISTGQVAGEQLERAGTAIVAANKATGRSIEELAAEYAQLGGSPLASLERLNKQHGFLTAEIYKQVKAAQDSGNAMQAAAIAQDAWSNAITKASSKVVENVGIMERAWRGLMSVVASVWNGMKSIGMENVNADMQRLQNTITSLEQIANKDGSGYAARKLQEARDELKVIQDRTNAEIKGAEERKKADQEREARLALQVQHEATMLGLMSDEKKLNLELEKLEKQRKAGLFKDEKEYLDTVAALREKFRKKEKKTASFVDMTEVNNTQNALNEITKAFDNSNKELDAKRSAGLVSASDYYQQRKALLSQERDAVTKAYQDEIKALEGTKGNANQRIRIGQQVADAQSKLVQAQAQYESEMRQLATQEEGRLKKEAEAVKVYTDALDQQYQALVVAGQRNVAALAMGSSQQGLFDQLNQLTDDINRQRLDLANQYGDGSRGMSFEEYSQKLTALEANHSKMARQIEQNYADIKAAQGDWTVGASAAWQNYLDDANDAAGRSQEFFEDAFQTMEDALTEFIMTGKVSFSDMANSIIADIIRINARQIVVGIGTSLFGSGPLGGSTGGGAAGGQSLLGAANNAYSLYQAGSGQGVLGGLFNAFQDGGLSGAWSWATSSLFGGTSSASSSVGFGLGQSLVGGSFGSSTYAGGSALGGAASSVPWLAIGSGILGGYSQGGIGGAALGGAGAYAGAALGSALGPIGTAIGGALGAALGSALGGSFGFGGSGERFKETYTSASGYTTGGAYTATGTPSQLAGKRMFGDDYDNYLNSVNEKFTGTLSGLLQEFGSQVDYVQSDIYARLRRTSGKIAADLTTNLPGMTEGDWTSLQWARSYGGDGKDIPGQLEKFANDVLGEWLAESITKMEALPEYFRAQFEELASNAETTAEDVQNKITSIFNSFNAVNEALDLVGISMLELTNEGMKASDAIAAAAGGYEALATAVNGFYDQFYSDQEKANRILEKVPESFADLEMTLPATREAYRAMVGDIDVTTEAGQQMFANMMSMAASADSYYDILEAKAANLLAMEQNFYTKFAPESVQTGNMIGGMITAMSELGLSIPNTREEFYKLVQTMDKSTESGRATYEGLLALTDGMDNYYTTVAALQAEAISRQSADRRAEIDERRAVQEAEAALQQQRRDDYAAAAQAYDEQRAAMLAAGDAVGYLTATVSRLVSNPDATNTPQTNFQWAQLLAREGFNLANELSKNALAVRNVGEAIADARSNFAGLNEYAPLVQGYIGSFLNAVGQGSSDIRQALQAASVGIAQVSIANTYATGQAGIGSILQARDMLDLVSQQGFAGGGWQYGADVVSYGRAIDSLNSLLRAGTITAEQYAAAVDDVNSYVGSVTDLFGDLEQQLGRIEMAQHQVALAGSQAIEFYLDKLGQMADATVSASEPLEQASGAIERLTSMAYAFGEAADATRAAGSYAPGFGPDYSQNTAVADIIAEYAQRAADALTTADAAQVAATLEQSSTFAELTDTALRDVAMLLDGISQYDAASFESAFIRISDALADGTINAAQYGELFEIAMGMFEGTAEAAVSYLDRVNAVLSDMSKALLPLDEIGEAAAARMVELAGGIDAFEQGYSTWFSQFLSEAEQQNKVMADVIEAFAKAGVPLADTRDAFSGMVNAIDTSTEAGQNMLATLLALMDEADSYYDIIDAREEEKRRAEQEYAAKQAEQLATYQRLRDALAASGLAMEGMTLITPELIAGFNDLAEQLGGVDAATGALSSYYQNFFTEAERQQVAIDAMTTAFTDAGIALPDARDGFRDMMENIDLTTEAGRSMFATLLGLAGTADAYFDEIERREAERKAAIAEFYQMFTPESVQQDATLAAFRGEMDKLGVSLPASRWQFGELVNGIDQTTEAGKALYDALLGARNAANEYYQILEQIAMSNAETVFARLQRAVAAEVAKINEALDKRTTEINAYYDEQVATQTAAYDLMLEQTQERYDAERAAAEAAYDAELAALEQQYQEQGDLADAAYQAQKDALALMLDTAQEALSSLNTIFSALEDGFNTVVGASEVMTQMARAQAEQVVSQALAMARGGQSLAGMATLPDAVSAVSDIATNQYSTSVEFLREQGRTANELFELKGYAEDQVTAQEALIASIEAQSDLLSEQFDAAQELAKSIFDEQEKAIKARFDLEQAAAKATLEATLRAMQDAKEQTLDQLERMRASDLENAQNAAQEQIDALNEQLAAAERQYNALKGIDDSIISVREALTQWAEALQAANEVQGKAVEARFANLYSVRAAEPATPVATVQPVLGITGTTYDERQASGDAMVMAEYNAWLERVASGTSWTGDMPRYGVPVPAYADGGMASGLYMAGEAGPELIVSGPARVHNANDTAKILAGAGSDKDDAALRQEVADLRQLLKLIAVNTKVAADGIRQQNDSGLPVMVVETV